MPAPDGAATMNKRVRLTIEFLHQKIEAAPDGFAQAEDAARFGDMCSEAIKLLVDIDALDLQHDFLLDTPRIERLFQFRQTRIETRTQRGAHVRQMRAHLGDDALDAIEAIAHEAAEAFAFARARCNHVSECRIENVECRFAQRFLISIAIEHHAGPTEQGGEINIQLRKSGGQRVRGFGQTCDQRLVDLERRCVGDRCHALAHDCFEAA